MGADIVKWLNAREGFGATQLKAKTAIVSIFAIAATVTAFTNMQLGNVG
jgi:hypothetical protein